MELHGLLKILPECEYPTEFLATRLLAKKSMLFADWELLIVNSNTSKSLQNTPFFPYLKKYGGPGIWRFLEYEHLWVYGRMNPSLRKTFASYFVYHECYTLTVCLRYLVSRRGVEAVLQKLQPSLLHQEIQKTLTSGSDLTKTLQALESYLASQADQFRGLAEQHAKNGIRGVEIFLRDRLFALILVQKQPPLLKIFFQQLIDFHNCIFLDKTIRWQIKAEPVMIPGGTIPADLFKRAYFSKDLTPVVRFLRLGVHPDPNNPLPDLENALLQAITRKLKISSYQRTVIGDILFYLWEQYRYSRNISIILNTALVDDILVREQIIA